MTDKKLRKLKRAALLELLIAQMEQNERLEDELSAVRTQLFEREIAIGNAGSIAEAALSLNHVFLDAEKAAAQYVGNVTGQCSEIIAEAQREAERIIREAELRASQIAAAAPSMPEAEPAPEPESVPEAVSEPEIIPEPEAVPELEITPEPEAMPEPEIIPEPEPVPESEVLPPEDEAEGDADEDGTTDDEWFTPSDDFLASLQLPGLSRPASRTKSQMDQQFDDVFAQMMQQNR